MSPALAVCAAKVLLKKAARCRCHGSWRRRVWAGGKGWWWWRREEGVLGRSRSRSNQTQKGNRSTTEG